MEEDTKLAKTTTDIIKEIEELSALSFEEGYKEGYVDGYGKFPKRSPSDIEVIKLKFKTNHAYTPIGHYTIDEFMGKWFVRYFNEIDILDKDGNVDFISEEEAKKAAQRDFEARVKRCIK